MLPPEIQETIHKLFIIMWATRLTPVNWKTSSTILIDKGKGEETNLSSYRPIGIANTLYKLWTRLITTTLYEYAEAHSLLSNTQAGFRNQKDTIHQLQNVIMSLEDAKFFKQDIYALIVDFTSAFNTTDHDRMLWIMYDLGFPTDAIDTVKNLYEDATTLIRLANGTNTGQIAVERGTIQGDTLSPFLFLLYMEPLLRWLHVGGRGYKHICIPNQNQTVSETHLANILSSASFADDLLSKTNTIQNLKIQARKVTLYSDWAALIISGSKTKVTGILYGHSPRDKNGVTPSQTLCQQLRDKIDIQGQKAQFITPDTPFRYLGVELTMNLNWKHQIQCMTSNLKEKLENLRTTSLTPSLILKIIRTAIIPSLTYSFAVTPCTPTDLEMWDNMVDRIIKDKFGLWTCTATAMIREDTSNCGLGVSSISVEYHRRMALALTLSLEDPSNRHRNVTLSLLTMQVKHLKDLATEYLTTREGTNHRIKRQLDYCMRARQLISVYSSKLHLTKQNISLFLDDFKIIDEALSLHKPPAHSFPTLIACITKPLLSLDIQGLHDLTTNSGTHIISVAQLKNKHSKITKKGK